jgi:hypothetical protein
MTDLEKKKQEVWVSKSLELKINDNLYTVHCYGFEAGVKAQKDLIVEAIKNIGIDGLIDESDWYEIFGEKK